MSEDEEIAQVLARLGINAIDVAPSKYFPVISDASTHQILEVRNCWQERGFDIVGMQSLLFGKRELNIFGSADERRMLLEHLKHVCRIGAGLGARRLVFGSPRNRDASGIEADMAHDIAGEFFLALGSIASVYGVTICIEANLPSAGCNFLINTEEAASFVRELSHLAIKLQLDTGTILAGGEELSEALVKNIDLIGHVHISEPGLVPAGDAQSSLKDLIRTPEFLTASQIMTIEMLATPSESHAVSVERAVRWVQSNLFKCRQIR